MCWSWFWNQYTYIRQPNEVVVAINWSPWCHVWGSIRAAGVHQCHGSVLQEIPINYRFKRVHWTCQTASNRSKKNHATVRRDALSVTFLALWALWPNSCAWSVGWYRACILLRKHATITREAEHTLNGYICSCSSAHIRRGVPCTS